MKVHLANPYRNWTILLVGSVVSLLVGLILLNVPIVYAANPGMDLWDCANGISAAAGGCDITQSGTSHGWNSTGNIGVSSHYTYGDVVPWRIQFTDLPATSGTVVAVDYLISFAKSPAYDYDYMANWYTTVQTITVDDPCVGTPLSGSCTQSSVIALPNDPTEIAGTCPVGPAGNGWTFPSGIMQGFGGITINGIAYNGTHACDGSTVDASVTVTFTTSGGANAILLWGEHIALPAYWVTVPSATESPYHIVLSSFRIDGVTASPCSGCGKQLQMKVQDTPTAVTLNSMTATAETSAGALFALAGLAGLVVAGAVVLARRRK